jgi:hypothetical protein
VAACVTEYVTGDRGKKIDLSDWWWGKIFQIRKVSVPCGDSDALAALRVLHNFTPTIQHPAYLWGAFCSTLAFPSVFVDSGQCGCCRWRCSHRYCALHHATKCTNWIQEVHCFAFAWLFRSFDRCVSSDWTPWSINW